MSGLALIALTLGVAALLAGAAIFLAYRLGRIAERAAIQANDNEVKDAQLEAAARRPGTRTELVDRLRDDRF